MNADMLLRLELQTLLDRYIETIDNDRLEEWPSFFVEDALYEIIPRENEDAGLPATVIRCENRRMMTDRVVSLRNANIFSPAVYRHFLSGLRVLDAADDSVDFSCNYLVINSNQFGESHVYQTGRYLDRVVRSDGEWKFSRKRVVFETSRVQTLLAIPI